DTELAWVSNETPFGAVTPYGSMLLDLTGYHDSPPYGRVTQPAPTIPGQRYKLSFDLASYEGASAYRGPVSVEVTIGSETNIFTSTPPGRGSQWSTLSLDFQASSSSTPLLIYGDSSKGGGYLGL